MPQEDKLDKVVHELLSDAEKAGIPWYMSLFNPKLWEAAKCEIDDGEKVGCE